MSQAADGNTIEHIFISLVRVLSQIILSDASTCDWPPRISGGKNATVEHADIGYQVHYFSLP